MEKRLKDIERQLTRLANQQKELAAIMMAEKTGMITVMAAEKIGFYSESQLRSFIKSGELKVYRPSKHRVLIDWQDFCAWLKRRSVVPKEVAKEASLFGDSVAKNGDEMQKPKSAMADGYE